MFIVCTKNPVIISLVKGFYCRFLGELKIKMTDGMLEELSEMTDILRDTRVEI